MFPDFLEPWRAAGRKLARKNIGEVLFSGATYQIEVKDALQSRWVFLQLSDTLRVKDIFCSCDESTERGSCVHMAAGCLFVYSSSKPLHLRFEESLWHRLFLSIQEKCGTVKPIIERT